MLMACSDFDGDIDARREIQLAELVNGFGCRFNDIEQALVGANLELLHRFLIDVRRAVHGELLDSGREGDRSCDLRSGALGGFNDLGRGGVENPVVERLETYPDFLGCWC